ncbi:MAG: hypothetical protein IJ729_06540 [Alloprevotella sp.]|nr:hypothetical protein [Alloprevotella sp.]
MEGGIGFMDIPRIIEETLTRVPFVPAPTLDDYSAINREARLVAARLTGSLKK